MPHDGSGRPEPEPAAEPCADRSDHVVAVSEREAPDAEDETADSRADTTAGSPDPFGGTRSSRLKDALDRWWTETTGGLTPRADTTGP